MAIVLVRIAFSVGAMRRLPATAYIVDCARSLLTQR
jgi:hypothetical protein